MILEIIGSLLTSVITGIFLILRFRSDVYPYGLKRALNKLVLSNWMKSLPQKIPVYNTALPKPPKEAGTLAQDVEWEIETPRKFLRPGDSDDVLLYGIDDNGNCLVVKFSRDWEHCAEVNIALRRNGESFKVSLQGKSENQTEVTLGNFKLEVVEPFRIVRLWYNGHMENTNVSGEDNLVHVALNFLWKPLENPKDFKKNANIHLLSTYLSGKGQFGEGIVGLENTIPSGFYQFGSFHGIVKIDDGNFNEDTLYLYGYRLRQLSSTCESSDNSFMELFAMRDVNGDAFRLMSINDEWIDGESSYSSFDIHQIMEVDVEATAFRRNPLIPKLFTLTDKKACQRIEIWPKYETIKIQNSIEILLLKAEINGKSAHGILIRKLSAPTSIRKDVTLDTNKMKNSLNIVDFPNESGNREEHKAFVDLESTFCVDISLVGGKGASLAKLALGNRKLKMFNTAKGFCATTQLFREMVDMQSLKNIFNTGDTKLEELCQKAIDTIYSSDAEGKLVSLVDTYLMAVFGNNRSQNLRFAVRSSGVLEDGTDLSCAGQNETFLGVDEKSIPDKIVKCWASLFTFKSVSYRLNHGQPAVSDMGVVIQEMVKAASAGVLFTAHPRTGNPFETLITANFGLGESVVSASCDPDTIVVKRTRSKSAMLDHSTTKNLVISERNIGTKKSKVVVSEDGNSTEVVTLSEQDSNRLCLTDSHVLGLTNVGARIAQEIGEMKPVDIEWAIKEAGDIYILQCRAMTSLDAWTDFEIIHQFDTAIRTSTERSTTANTGEVMPKPLHAIAIQSMARSIDIGVQYRSFHTNGNPICSVMSRTCSIFGSRCFLNVCNTLYRSIDAEITPAVACIDLTVFGRPVITNEVHQIALDRFGASWGMNKLMGFISSIQLVRSTRKMFENVDAKYSKWTFDPKIFHQASPETIFNRITDDMICLQEITLAHCCMSAASSVTLVFTFMAMTEGKKHQDWPPQLYEDVGKLLSAYSEVESAEIPNDMNALGEAIKLQESEKFLNFKSAKEAVLWLRGHKELNTALDKFLDKHGHRSVAELDIGADSWRTDPTPLITLLQNVVRNKLKTTTKLDSSKFTFTNDQDLLNSLTTPLKPGTKRFLKFLLPYCRKMVVYRERTKSLTVRVLDQLKQAYTRLGELMVEGHYISEKNLIKHLTHHEMGLLLQKHPSTSSIIYRAMRRVRLYPFLETVEYPEITVGIPLPIDNSASFETTDVIRGTPVSAGKIKGVAKVCLSVEEASEQIEDGDILITKATDIAWSPFFPMLGGVVTELGGLISHGAVVAREYGLPCIVGAVNATKIINSGDVVILDTSTGTLSRVKTSSVEINGIDAQVI